MNQSNYSDNHELGRLGMKNRATGELIDTGVPYYADDIPFRFPHPETTIWRYMTWTKFDDLISNRQLYFRRSDRLDDDMEGRYSKANRQFRTALWQRFHDAYTIHQNFDQSRQINESFRYRAFLTCWNMNRHESATMWKLYARSADSVVIRSRCNLLDLAVAGRAYPAVIVRYASQDEPRPEYHSLAPFVFKNTSFSFEREVRVIFWANDESIDIDGGKDVCRILPVKPERLILEVRTHPASSKHFRRKVEKLCASLLPQSDLFVSSLHRSAVS